MGKATGGRWRSAGGRGLEKKVEGERARAWRRRRSLGNMGCGRRPLQRCRTLGKEATGDQMCFLEPSVQQVIRKRVEGSREGLERPARSLLWWPVVGEVAERDRGAASDSGSWPDNAWRHLAVTVVGRGCYCHLTHAQRPGTLPRTLQCTGPPPQGSGRDVPSAEADNPFPNTYLRRKVGVAWKSGWLGRETQPRAVRGWPLQSQ